MKVSEIVLKKTKRKEDEIIKSYQSAKSNSELGYDSSFFLGKHLLGVRRDLPSDTIIYLGKYERN